jgi:ABC-type phosphate transport system permease subunit
VANGDDPDPFGTKTPYWRRHYGIARPWSPTSAGRRGCLLMLYAAFAMMVVALVIAGVVALAA